MFSDLVFQSFEKTSLQHVSLSVRHLNFCVLWLWLLVDVVSQETQRGL